METQRMTIHRALSELKLIDSRIEKQIMEITPVGIHQKDKLVNNFVAKDDFKSNAQSKYDSAIDLIARKTLIKSAIVKANGETSVSIGGKTMTIADAINFKQTIKFKKQLIEKLKSASRGALAQMNQNNQLVEQNIQRILEATFGKENTKVSKEDMDNVRKPYMEANEFHLFNPLEVEKKIEALEKEVSDFEIEVDATLSEINATTFIEI